jgi:alpha-tubulin suppressor-like RCC1 family protein/uncharacterized protein YunC (DUF1805 family)
MSQTKVQLIAPIGVVTASTLETTGVLTATTFVGDIAGTVTGITSTTDNLNLGIITATSFAGDFTGIGSGLTGTPNVVAGVVTATKFVGNTPGLVSGIADGTNINAGIITATSFVGNLTGNAAGLSTTTAHVNLGIVTATSYSGSGANLDGVSSGPVAQQAVTANGATTTIDLSSGNVIYMTQSSNTTVAFANTEGNTDVVYLIRNKDDNTTARTITWPSGMVWNGGTEPTLLSNAGGAQVQGQVFKLTTRDNGATWYGKEVVNMDNIAGYGRWNFGGIGGYGGAGTNVGASYYTSPVQTAGTWSALSVGNIRTQFALRANRTLWGSGRNYVGEMGVNNTTAYSSPIQIPGTNWGNMLTGSTNASSLLTKTDGTLWAIGYNHYGGLAQNNRTQYSSPVQIPGTTWRSSFWSVVQGSNQWSCAIRTDGTLWSWGYGMFGQLGTNESGGSMMKSSPVQVPGTTWSKIGGDGNNPFGIKTDGTLWSWGYNSRGQLGLNSTVHRSSPTQIPGTTWKEAVGNGQSSGAIKTDGTLWLWGDDQYGQLAQNQTATQRWSSPVQVPGTTWNAIRIGGSSTFYANKTDGTLWSWGANLNGEMGAGSAGTLYSSPVQIPGTNWKSVEEYGFGTNMNGGAILRSS